MTLGTFSFDHVWILNWNVMDYLFSMERVKHRFTELLLYYSESGNITLEKVYISVNVSSFLL